MTEFSSDNMDHSGGNGVWRRRFKVLVFAVIAAIVASMFSYAVLDKLLGGGDAHIDTSVDLKLIEKVGKQIDLPQDETPTVATVTDLNQLKDQEFFQKAQLGDKVLIFTKYGKAILYRPGDNQVIEYGPLNVGERIGQPGF